MKLRISWRKRRIAHALYIGGIVIMCASIPLAMLGGKGAMVLMLAGGFAAGLAGALWCGWLYRCPQCGQELLSRGWENLTLTTYRHCPNCGWAVDIEYTDR